MKERFDVAIVGSGFAGSILARVLAGAGKRVLLIDSMKHPRFAIGESSTPIADFLLRQIGRTYGLDDLVDLSSYGSWQSRFPNIPCGMKRGFSYFDHRFDPTDPHEKVVGARSLLVAASPSDSSSDTHWYRSQVDEYLYNKAIDSGVEAWDASAVVGVQIVDDSKVIIQLKDASPSNHDRRGHSKSVESRVLIDATGSGGVVARLCGQGSMLDQIKTCTTAAYGHYTGVSSFSRLFDDLHGDSRSSIPFDADDAAQHHLIDNGWVWMLRMNNGVNSVGTTLFAEHDRDGIAKASTAALECLRSRFRDWPLLHQVMRDSRLIDPPNGIVTTGRLQRLFDPVIAPNCWMLPTAAFTLDPLHSTGIAHALWGVARTAAMLIETDHDSLRLESIRYRDCVLREAFHLDRMVYTAYKAMGSFRRFHAACMVYFAAAISTEEQIASGRMPSTLWLADDDAFVEVTKRVAVLVESNADDADVHRNVKQWISPWNFAGLMERHDHRYAYTATK